MRVAPTFVLLAALALPTFAASADPMTPFNYYAGGWSCSEGMIGGSMHKSIWTFLLKDGLMFQSVVIPKQGDMSAPYVENATFAYDAKNGRYVETEMDNTSAWYVSIAKPDSSSTIRWRDIASSARPERWDMTPVDANEFIVNSYPSVTAEKPNYRALCKRASSS